MYIVQLNTSVDSSLFCVYSHQQQSSPRSSHMMTPPQRGLNSSPSQAGRLVDRKPVLGSPHPSPRPRGAAPPVTPSPRAPDSGAGWSSVTTTKFICGICQNEFTTKRAMQHHQRTQHGGGGGEGGESGKRGGAEIDYFDDDSTE